MYTSERGNGKYLNPSEFIAEDILALLDEPDSSDKQWREPIFRQLPKRFAENAATTTKKPISLMADVMRIDYYSKPLGGPLNLLSR